MPTQLRQMGLLVGALLFVVIVGSVTILVARTVTEPELQKALFQGAITLIFVGVLGGVVKLLLDDVAVERRKREDAAAFVGNVLNDVKGVYDQVARAQIVIAAHRSAKTYGDEMRGLIEARVQLRNVKRALTTYMGGVPDGSRQKVEASIDTMEGYLGTLTSEFIRKYKVLSDKQRAYEAYASELVATYARSGDATRVPELPTFVWDSIERLPRLSAFLAAEQEYTEQFEKPLELASRQLRHERARIIGQRRGAPVESTPTTPGSPPSNAPVHQPAEV